MTDVDIAIAEGGRGGRTVSVVGGDVAGVDAAILHLIVGEVRSLRMEDRSFLEESTSGGRQRGSSHEAQRLAEGGGTSGHQLQRTKTAHDVGYVQGTQASMTKACKLL